MSLNDVALVECKKKRSWQLKAIRSKTPIILKMQSTCYQRNTYELDPTIVLPTLNILPLHEATNTMHAKIPVATPEGIQPSNKFYRFIQNLITLQQQSNIDMRFNPYIDQERNQNFQFCLSCRTQHN